MQCYTREFYHQQREGSRRSAGEIVPLVLDLVRPVSVVDVGCGVGTWLAVFKEHGVADILGIDGDHVDPGMLEIPEGYFLRRDLRQAFSLSREFDLVVSLEVAEHLPADCAASFVETLARLGPVILFSAAIPFQGGTHHLNEQWPDYWVSRFEGAGYVVVDCLRRAVWQNDKVDWWYAQNVLMFATPAYLARNAALKDEQDRTDRRQLSLVHPRKHLETMSWLAEVAAAAEDIEATIPTEAAIILVDDARCGVQLAGGRLAIPFLERNGRYWGPPPDDATAIQELERLRARGAAFLVVAWPAAWWLDYYTEFHRYLRSEFRCVLENDRLVVFDVRWLVDAPSAAGSSHVG